MKKNTFKGMLISGVLFASTGLYAQSPALREQIEKHSDVVRLKELAVKFNEKYQASHAEALKLAAQNNWPVRVETKDGGLMTLIKMSPYGFPLYYGTSNVGSAITSRANTLQPGGSTGLNLTGGDIFLGVWDGEYPLISHVDINGRAVANDGPPSPVNLHPTHVLGTILGSGVGNALAKGMATQASATVNNYDNDITEMTQQATSIVASNHSYGLVATQLPSWFFGTYSEDSQDLDDLLFSAPYYQAIFAAGNDNNNATYDLLTGNAASKNAIVVAAINEVDDYTGPSSVTIASFSNWGPTDDNRIKPDISSKGVNVFSTSNASTTSYAYLDGTSMATPGITGVVALLQQHYFNLHQDYDVPFMKSATLRGLIAHTADEAGANDGPDVKFGWGLMNAQKAAAVISNDKTATTASIKELTLLPGETYSLNVHALGTEPLIATLAWTDPAGSITTGGTAAVLINDLDIRVTQGSQVTYPWKLGTSNTAAALKGDNTKDNIEKTELPTPSGNYTITISHKGNTLVNPGTGASPSQEYSLIISGIDVTAGVDKVTEQMFTVYPNPANDQLTISLNTAFDNGQASIIDVQGRNVMNFAVNAATTVLDINSLNSGVYFVKIASGNHTEVKKVIVN